MVHEEKVPFYSGIFGPNLESKYGLKSAEKCKKCQFCESFQNFLKEIS